ncbi:MAG: M23 family metallopeptidase [Flavobacteriales bacterium]|jgi:murein DD-endopeptidase MepM/ murein hydrolase activator NlpD|nr:M23 family metallopeptidase [Flavobacteriales bacterium]
MSEELREREDNFKFIQEFGKKNQEDRIIFSLKRKQLIRVIIGAFALIFILISLLYFLTPMKQLIPGFPDKKMYRNLYEVQFTIDSLKNINRINQQYFENINAIASGEINSIMPQEQSDSIKLGDPNVKKNELKLRKRVEQEEAHNTLDIETKNNLNYSFLKPIEGIVTERFNPSTQHFGIDIVATENAPIKAIQGGTVVFSGWTSEDGYVIFIQHSENLLSIYKHNSSLLKSIGENVLPGEVIALIGNTGELSQGIHLHIELWQNGYPIDPEKLINY